MTGKTPAVSFFCIKSTAPWLRTASWKHGLLQHLCFGFPIRGTLVTLQTLNKTSTTKLSSILCFNWSPHGNIWQHSKLPRPEPTRTGPAAGFAPHTRWGPRAVPRWRHFEWLPATMVMKVGQTAKNNVVNKDASRCFN